MNRLSILLSPARRRGVALALAIAALAVTAQAGEKRVTIGEVSSKVVGTGVNYEALLRAASEDEVQALDLSQVPRGKRVIVSVSLVRLDTRALDTSCEVSAAVRDAKGGTMIAILSGRAHGSSGRASAAATSSGATGIASGNGEGAPRSLENALVHGAIHGALAHIPEVLAR